MQPWLVSAAVSGFLCVAIGAFGAHGLEGRLDAREAEWWATGLRYQMFHAVALLAVALLVRSRSAGLLTLAGWGFLVGSVVFSGLLYAMALGGPRWFGAVVPVGGVAFLLGWGALVGYALRGGQGHD